MRGAPAIRPKYATLVEMLDAAAQSDLGLVFVNRKEQDLDVPFARIREQALSVAADLVRRGVRKGDRVALVLPTSPEFVYCFFGVLCAGAVPVPLYPPLRLGKLDEFHRRTAAMLKAVDAAMVVTDERIRRFLGAAVANSAPALGCVTASSLGGSISDAVEVAADDVAVIQFSSGTTNDPKPVALTHANLLSNLATLERYITADGCTARRRHVAAALPRHGIDRKSPQRFLFSRKARIASPRAVRRDAGRVAEGHLAAPGDYHGGAQLRFRPVPQAHT